MDNHEKETKKQKLNFPLVAHTHALDSDDDYDNPLNLTARWKY